MMRRNWSLSEKSFLTVWTTHQETVTGRLRKVYFLGFLYFRVLLRLHIDLYVI